MVSPRIQRWAVTLRACEYIIISKAGKYHGNADALNWLPLPDTPRDPPEDRMLTICLSILLDLSAFNIINNQIVLSTSAGLGLSSTACTQPPIHLHG
ncbi:hypothetical protein AAFF_G00033190 [Aldrovandia affinis]|uniref:Uncharacterized protein n=1 Tax=Aldrovandia affinis TaxID=143900 RepID=A0AAD7S3K2_9TELE|nr:hypothetical protein AAFF_G00033190 [Aldrovandia affinis]